MPDTDTCGGPETGAQHEWMSIGDAAALIGYSVDSLRRWDREGILTARRPHPKGQRRYRRADVLAFIHKNEKVA